MIELNAENVYNYLVTIAKNPKNTITYKEMEEKCGWVRITQKNVQQLIDILNLTMAYNKLRNEPFIATLVVVNKERKIPGNGLPDFEIP